MNLATARTLGETLRAHRMAAGLTQSTLARAAAVSIRALRDIEHDRVLRPHRPTLLRLAQALGLPPAEQREDAAEPRSPYARTLTGPHRLPLESLVDILRPAYVRSHFPAGRVPAGAGVRGVPPGPVRLRHHGSVGRLRRDAVG